MFILFIHRSRHLASVFVSDRISELLNKRIRARRFGDYHTITFIPNYGLLLPSDYTQERGQLEMIIFAN